MSQNIFDKLLELRNVADGAETATASETGIALAVRFLPVCEWVIFCTAMGVVATETYVFTLEVSNLVGGTYTAIARHVWPIAHGIGEVHVPINGDLAAWQDTDSAFLRVTATLGGTTPTVTYGSFLSKQGRKMGGAYEPGDIITV
jgi:hypothetical protein